MYILWISRIVSFFFFFNDTATTEIYTLSLHDALPISPGVPVTEWQAAYERMLSPLPPGVYQLIVHLAWDDERSEEHTSELQSRLHLVCRLLLEKKNQRAASPSRLS